MPQSEDILQCRTTGNHALFVQFFSHMIHSVVGKQGQQGIDSSRLANMKSFDEVRCTADTEAFCYFQWLDKSHIWEWFANHPEEPASSPLKPEPKYTHSKMNKGHMKPGGKDCYERVIGIVEENRQAPSNNAFLEALKDFYDRSLGDEQRKRKASKDAREARAEEDAQAGPLRAEMAPELKRRRMEMIAASYAAAAAAAATNNVEV